MDALDLKLAEAFAGKIVRKDLVRKVKVGANVPVFVLEYLLGKFVKDFFQTRFVIDLTFQV